MESLQTDEPVIAETPVAPTQAPVRVLGVECEYEKTHADGSIEWCGRIGAASLPMIRLIANRSHRGTWVVYADMYETSIYLADVTVRAHGPTLRMANEALRLRLAKFAVGLLEMIEGAEASHAA